MKVVWSTLLMLFCILGLLLLAAYLTNDSGEPAGSNQSVNTIESRPPADQTNRRPSSSSNDTDTQQSTQIQGRTQLNNDVVNVSKFKNLTKRHKVTIHQLQNIDGGIDVKLSARDHVATGDLLTSLIDAGIMRDFEQMKNDMIFDQQGNRIYLSEIKIYWR